MARATAFSRVDALVKELSLERVSGKEWDVLRARLPEVSEHALRKALLQLGVVVEQPWKGVDTSTLDTLEISLAEVTAAYEREPRVSRAAIIAAKDKTRFVSRNPRVDERKQALKSEMVEWMLVWLDDPRMFANWVRLRRAYLASSRASENQP
jgi:hypothetical protein